MADYSDDCKHRKGILCTVFLGMSCAMVHTSTFGLLPTNTCPYYVKKVGS